MKPYPIFLVGLARRRCLVVGGGQEAERKVAELLACEAALTVISPAVTERLRQWAEAGRLSWIERAYRLGDLRGAFLVVAEKADAATNEQIWQEAEAEGALVNVMDDIPHCAFIAGSVVRRGPLVVSISTSGVAPALAVRLRQRMEEEFGPEYELFLEWLAALRRPLAARYPDFEERRRRWYELVDSDVLELLRAGRVEEARRRVAEIAGAECDLPTRHFVVR